MGLLGMCMQDLEVLNVRVSLIEEKLKMKNPFLNLLAIPAEQKETP